jgi:hypothetical protein
MHEVEAATITSDKLAGQEDVSKCLPGWIKTMCDAFAQGKGYTLSHSAVSALAHTLICARVRAERLVRERDEAREKNWADHYFRQWQEAQEQIKQLLSGVDYWSYATELGMRASGPEKAEELRDFLSRCAALQEIQKTVMARGTQIVFIRASVHANASDRGIVMKHENGHTYLVQRNNRPEFFKADHGVDFIAA